MLPTKFSFWRYHSIILICWLGVNDAIPYGVHTGGKRAYPNSPRSPASTKNAGSVAERFETIDGTSTLETDSTDTLLRRRGEINSNININIGDDSDFEPDRTETLSADPSVVQTQPENPNTNECTQSKNSGLNPNDKTTDCLREHENGLQTTKDEIVPQECPATGRRSNEDPSQNSPRDGSPINVEGVFEVGGEADAKKTSNVYTGEGITVCWIELITIREDTAVSPPKKLVIREFAISFENSDTIPEKDMDCSRIRGEILPGEEKAVCESSLNEMVVDDTKRSRVVEFAKDSQDGTISIRQYKKVKCATGGVVSKTIYEWPDGTDNPKKRVEIKVAPSVQNVRSGKDGEPAICGPEAVVADPEGEVTSTSSSECPTGASCETSTSASCEDGTCASTSLPEESLSSKPSLEPEQAAPSQPKNIGNLLKSTIASSPGSDEEISQNCSEGNCAADPVDNLEGVEDCSQGDCTTEPSNDLESAKNCSQEDCAAESSDETPDEVAGDSASSCKDGHCTSEEDSTTSQEGDAVTEAATGENEECQEGSEGCDCTGSSCSGDAIEKPNSLSAEDKVTEETATLSSEELPLIPRNDTACDSESQECSSASPISSSDREDTSDASPISSSDREDTSDASPISSSDRGDTSDASPISSSDREDTSDASAISSSDREDTTVASPESSSDREDTTVASPESSSDREDTTVAPPESSSDREDTTVASPESSSDREDTTVASPTSSSEREDTTVVSPSLIDGNEMPGEVNDLVPGMSSEEMSNDERDESVSTTDTSSTEIPSGSTGSVCEDPTSQDCVTVGPTPFEGTEQLTLETTEYSPTTESTMPLGTTEGNPMIPEAESSEAEEPPCKQDPTGKNCETTGPRDPAISQDVEMPSKIPPQPAHASRPTSGELEFNPDPVDSPFTPLPLTTTESEISMNQDTTEVPDKLPGSEEETSTHEDSSIETTAEPSENLVVTTESCDPSEECDSTGGTLNFTELVEPVSITSATSTESCEDNNCNTTSDPSADASSTVSCEDCDEGSSSENCGTSESSEQIGSEELVDNTTTEPTPTINNVSETTETRRTTVASELTQEPEGKHKLKLRIKVLLEHINDKEEKEKLVQLEKHLLLDEMLDQHGNHSLIWHLKSLNNSMNIETVKSILNLTDLDNLTEIFSQVTEYSEAGTPTTQDDRESNWNEASLRAKRDISKANKTIGKEKNCTDAAKTKAIKESLPGVNEDFQKGLGHVLGALSDEINGGAPRAANKSAESSTSTIMEILADPGDKRVHSRRQKRATNVKDMSIEEMKHPVDGKDTGRWSNERFVMAGDGGRVRSLLEFEIMRDPSDDLRRIHLGS